MGDCFFPKNSAPNECDSQNGNDYQRKLQPAGEETYRDSKHAHPDKHNGKGYH